MKVLILACLVALALAREKEEINVIGLEATANINQAKVERLTPEAQQQEDIQQDKINPFYQIPFFPEAQFSPYVVLLNAQPLAQPCALTPETMEADKAKETISPKHTEVPFIKSPFVNTEEHQYLTVNNLENPNHPAVLQHLKQLPPQNNLMVFPFPQPLQLKAQPVVQQAVPYVQREMPFQAFPHSQKLVLSASHQPRHVPLSLVMV
ncbi:beta-casein [Erinaceus europaeus]|uniref:Beta-casein n=1 Tax=Erinaceus europaeus TaxID=9365 RepID=A0A1S2ZRX7_ERIEU|nr:beta-casein [Erinaceus europaeus]